MTNIRRIFKDKTVLNDKSTLSDRADAVGDENNFIRISNADTGRVLVKKRLNIVTHRGRTFALELLYQDENDFPVMSGGNPVYTRNLDRTINLFKIGSGGTPINDPFSPIIPSPTDSELAIPVPFRSVDESLPGQALTSAEEADYHLSKSEGGFLNYYGKTFVAAPVWSIDPATNTVYKRIDLLIDLLDARDHRISELGLVISTSSFSDDEVYSRVTFPTENLQGSKRLLVEYYTYA